MYHKICENKPLKTFTFLYRYINLNRIPELLVSFFFPGHDSDSYSSTAESVQERAASSHHKDQNQALLDKLTQEKLDSKTKVGSKRNDLSSGMAQIRS